MDTNALKKFAQAARNLLIDQVRSKLDLVIDPASPARREHPKAMKELDAAIARDGKRQVIEQVAYTWFNRFTALRFMDANGYTVVGTVSPAEGQTRPELLAEAMAGNLPEGAPGSIAALLDGRTPSSDPQAEAYRQLLVHACNQWHGLMPFLFEEIDDYTELLMPEDLLSQSSILARLREVMTKDACKDVEIIGWLYQFYISEKKDQVFASLKKNQKITAENIPAATQLFTPHWIVRYLVENSLGRLWLLNRPQSRLAERMDYYIAPEEPETDFLKITRPEDIRMCDPAAGSGHMLTYAFDLLYAIYEEEGYDATEIPALILTHNLTGVEIDDRAGALAAFALAMKAAARLGRRRFLRMEALPDICVLQNVAFTEAELQDVAAVVGKDLFTDELHETLGQFEQARNFGSLIVPKLRDPAETLRMVEARDFGGDLLLKEVQERVVAVLRMAEALSTRYHVVVANPPYMGAGSMTSMMISWAKKNYPMSKPDLYTMFIERSASLSSVNGYMAFVTIQNWMFLTSFEKFRVNFLEYSNIRSLIQIGFNSFPELNSKIVQAAAAIVQRSESKNIADFINLNDAPQSSDKNKILISKIEEGEIYRKHQDSLKNLPGSPIAYWLSDIMLGIFDKPKVSSVAFAKMGMRTGNNERFLRQWFEVPQKGFGRGFLNAHAAKYSRQKWFPYQKGGENRKWYGVQDLVVNWHDDGNEIKALTRQNYPDLGDNLSWKITNEEFYFRKGGGWTALTSGQFSVRYYPQGFIIDTKGQCFYEKNSKKIELIIGTVNTKIFEKLIAVTCPSLDFNSGPVGATPFLELKATLEGEVDYNSTCLIALSKSDWDAYETSWDFAALPLLQSDHRAETLEATYTALRTHWQGMTDEMQRLEEENNRIFIDAYGLQDELTPEVPLNEITLTCNPAYRYGIKNDAAANETRLRADTMAEFLSYAVGCMLGRYSLDAPGLILANQGEGIADYVRKVASGQGLVNSGGGSDGDTQLQGSDRLAESHGSRGAGLSGNEAVSEGGNIRAEQSATASGGVRAVEHRGGAGPSIDGGVPELPFGREGIAGGGGNATADRAAAGLSGTGASGKAPLAASGGQQDAPGPDGKTGHIEKVTSGEGPVASAKAGHSTLATGHLSFMPDEDNVIPVLDGDWFPDDITERFRLFLRVTFGEAHFQENLRYIEEALGKDIRKYFTRDFYADHVKRYRKRPIYWMFSSPKGTFSALIYMHRYRPDTVSVLLNDYLREFISKLEGERGRLEKLSDDPSASQGQRTRALKDMAVIARQIDELNEWEREVVFPLAQSRIGIDLDDGVKANYPKFGAALKPVKGLEARDE